MPGNLPDQRNDAIQPLWEQGKPLLFLRGDYSASDDGPGSQLFIDNHNQLEPQVCICNSPMCNELLTAKSP